jgi:hypothetical protein
MASTMMPRTSSKHGGGQDGDAFGGVHLAALAEDARADADGGGGGDGAQEQGGGIQPAFGQAEPDRAAGAQIEGQHHAADADHGAGDGIAQEGGQVGFQAGQEQQNDGGHGGDGMEFRRHGAGFGQAEQVADHRPAETPERVRGR